MIKLLFYLSIIKTIYKERVNIKIWIKKSDKFFYK